MLAVGAGWYLLGQPGLDDIQALVKSDSSSVTIAETTPEAAAETAPEVVPETASEAITESVAVSEPPLAMESTSTTELQDEPTNVNKTVDDSESRRRRLSVP